MMIKPGVKETLEKSKFENHQQYVSTVHQPILHLFARSVDHNSRFLKLCAPS